MGLRSASRTGLAPANAWPHERMRVRIGAVSATVAGAQLRVRMTPFVADLLRPAVDMEP